MPTDFPLAAAQPLPGATHLGRVHLDVASLPAQIDFYTRVIGLQVLSQDAGQARLGAGGRELLRLSVKPGARRYEGHAGLYHFCLAVPDRRAFGRLLRRVIDSGLPLQGLVDHHAAEAIYLPDAEGNGVELNWDRPREVWAKAMAEIARRGNGPLDVEGLLALADAAGSAKPVLPDDAFVGHIHLHVADLQAGRDFYHGRLGFDIMAEFPRAAVFTSAGGYHHHIAFNIWNGRGAAAAPADATGLHDFTVLLPTRADLDALVGRLRGSGTALEADGEAWTLQDPAGNHLRLACD